MFFCCCFFKNLQRQRKQNATNAPFSTTPTTIIILSCHVVSISASALLICSSPRSACPVAKSKGSNRWQLIDRAGLSDDETQIIGTSLGPIPSNHGRLAVAQGPHPGHWVTQRIVCYPSSPSSSTCVWLLACLCQELSKPGLPRVL